MPSFQLSEQDVADLVSYTDARTKEARSFGIAGGRFSR
jgi:hypothetical protein